MPHDDAGRDTSALCIAAVAAIVLFVCLIVPRAPAFDDAYIPLHSAHVLVEGADRVFGVAPLIGATSPPHVAFLAALVALGLPDSIILRVAMVSSMAAYVAALWLLAGAVGLPRWTAVGFVAVGVFGGAAYLQVTNGLETGFALAAVVGAIAAILTDRTLVAGLLIGAVASIRPDLALIAVALAAWAVWRRPRRWPQLLLATAAVIVPFLVWVWRDTGGLLPNTMFAKRAYYADSCLPVATKFAAAGLEVGKWLVIVLPLTLIGIPGLIADAPGGLLAGAALLTLVPLALVLPHGLAFTSHRYLYPILLPLLLLGAARGLRRYGRTPLVVATTALIAMIPTQLVQVNAWHAQSRELTDARDWIASSLPADAVIAAHDAGIVSFTGRRVVDLVGLKTPSSAGIHEAMTLPSCGADRPAALRAIVTRTPADFVMVLRDWDEAFGMTQAMHATAVVRRPASGSSYGVYRLPVPVTTGARGALSR